MQLEFYARTLPNYPSREVQRVKYELAWFQMSILIDMVANRMLIFRKT
jgi:hypothetical protein